MGYWDTRAGTLGRLKYFLSQVEYHQEALADRTFWMMYYVSQGDWTTAFAKCNQAFEMVSWCLSFLVGRKSSDYRDYARTYFLEEYTIAECEAPEPEPLTWKDIVKAWGTATLPGMMWSVTMIDLMRRQCWNEPENTKWQENPFE